jgi:hypothetical protein
VRRKRFSVEQMVAILKQAEVGVPVLEVCGQRESSVADCCPVGFDSRAPGFRTFRPQRRTLHVVSWRRSIPVAMPPKLTWGISLGSWYAETGKVWLTVLGYANRVRRYAGAYMRRTAWLQV